MAKIPKITAFEQRTAFDFAATDKGDPHADDSLIHPKIADKPVVPPFPKANPDVVRVDLGKDPTIELPPTLLDKAFLDWQLDIAIEKDIKHRFEVKWGRSLWDKFRREEQVSAEKALEYSRQMLYLVYDSILKAQQLQTHLAKMAKEEYLQTLKLRSVRTLMERDELRYNRIAQRMAIKQQVLQDAEENAAIREDAILNSLSKKTARQYKEHMLEVKQIKKIRKKEQYELDLFYTTLSDNKVDDMRLARIGQKEYIDTAQQVLRDGNAAAKHLEREIRVQLNFEANAKDLAERLADIASTASWKHHTRENKVDENISLREFKKHLFYDNPSRRAFEQILIDHDLKRLQAMKEQGRAIEERQFKKMRSNLQDSIKLEMMMDQNAYLAKQQNILHLADLQFVREENDQEFNKAKSRVEAAFEKYGDRVLASFVDQIARVEKKLTNTDIKREEKEVRHLTVIKGKRKEKTQQLDESNHKQKSSRKEAEIKFSERKSDLNSIQQENLLKIDNKEILAASELVAQIEAAKGQLVMQQNQLNQRKEQNASAIKKTSAIKKAG